MLDAPDARLRDGGATAWVQARRRASARAPRPSLLTGVCTSPPACSKAPSASAWRTRTSWSTGGGAAERDLRARGAERRCSAARRWSSPAIGLRRSNSGNRGRVGEGVRRVTRGHSARRFGRSFSNRIHWTGAVEGARALVDQRRCASSPRSSRRCMPTSPPDRGVTIVVPVRNGERWLEHGRRNPRRRGCSRRSGRGRRWQRRSFRSRGDVNQCEEPRVQQSTDRGAEQRRPSTPACTKPPTRLSARSIRTSRCSAEVFATVDALDDHAIGAAQGVYVPRSAPFSTSRASRRSISPSATAASISTDRVYTGNTAYRHSALIAAGLLDEALGYGYDNDLSYRLASAGYALVMFPAHGASTTGARRSAATCGSSPDFDWAPGRARAAPAPRRRRRGVLPPS